MMFSKKVKHTCTLGGERWVSDDPDWVIYNNHSPTIKLHKIIYMSMSAYQWGKQGKDTCMYKKKYKQDKEYINILGEHEEVCNQLVKQLSMS